MTRKMFAVIGVATVAVLLIIATSRVLAEETGRCYVTVTTPHTGDRAGVDVLVTGKAVVAPGNSLWAFARRRGLLSAWPQAGGAIVPDLAGNYSVLVVLGTPNETGDFEVFIQVVDAVQNAKLETWFRQAELTGRYPGMPVPPFVAGCGVPTTLTLTKTSN